MGGPSPRSQKAWNGLSISAMVEAAKGVARDVQSEEATFLTTNYDSIEAQRWFGGNLQKIVSISAAIMSVGLVEHL